MKERTGELEPLVDRGRGVLLTDQPLLELVGVTGGDCADVSLVAKYLQQISLRVAPYQLC